MQFLAFFVRFNLIIYILYSWTGYDPENPMNYLQKTLFYRLINLSYSSGKLLSPFIISFLLLFACLVLFQAPHLSLEYRFLLTFLLHSELEFSGFFLLETFVWSSCESFNSNMSTLSISQDIRSLNTFFLFNTKFFYFHNRR